MLSSGMNTSIEVIGIREEYCINCHQCISVCPVKICSDGSGEVVKFNNQLCIGCGRCIEACIKSHGGVVEKSARIPIDDTPLFLQNIAQKEIIALVAPSAQANFDLKKLITALRCLGAFKVYDVSLGAEITVAGYHHAIAKGCTPTPLIGQPCPVVVKYIELNHPALIPHLAPVGSPVHNLAVYVKSIYPGNELAFISPCLAKRREFQDSHLIKYNVVFQSLQMAFNERGIELASLPDGNFDNEISAGIAAAFSTPGGLKQTYLNRYPETSPTAITQIEGSVVYSKYLYDLERAIVRGDADLPLLIDILNCEKGCNMGSGCVNHRDSMDRIERSVGRRAEQAQKDSANEQRLRSFIADVLQHLDFSYNSYRDLSGLNKLQIPTPTELKVIYERMHKSDEKDFRNCGACGYHSCYYMAVAVYNGLNKAENCHLYQEKELLLEQKILNDMVVELETLNEQLQAEFNERKTQEQLLVQNCKLAAMGEMIGMIAHQWRQPLSSISTLAGNLQVLIELDMFDAEQFMQLLAEINNHSQYLSNTINDFRHFFKPDNPRDIVTVDSVVENTLGIIGKSLEYKNIKLIREYQFQHHIMTYPTELMQVFLNLFKNAVDALVEKEIPNPVVIIRGHEDTHHQIIEIEDNAGGIPDDILPLVFNPYFSTKGPALGTGVGLYMSKMIVEEHCQGELSAHNGTQGACFTLKLPIEWGGQSE